MSFYSNIYSHPDKYLEDHLLNVAKCSKEFLQNSEFKNRDFLAEISFIIGISHDFAKATSFFQDLLFNGKRSKKARHGFLSAVFTYYNLSNFLKMEAFNDNSSYHSINSVSFSVLGYLAVIRHHGNLKSVKTNNGTTDEIEILKETFDELEPIVEDLLNQIAYFNKNNNLNDKNIISFSNFYKRFDIDIIDFLNNYSKIKNVIREDLRNLLKSKEIFNYLNLNILYSVLLDGDKLDASGTKIIERKEISQDIVDTFKKEKFTNHNAINKIREKSYLDAINKIDTLDIIKNKIYSLELPTGCGKTLTGFSFALKLRDKIKKELNFTPRIIYSLPFLSIIDQNESIIREILDYFSLTGSDFLLKHNYMSDMNYILSQDRDDELNENKSQLLTEGWYSEIIITTFIQLFYTLISNKNKSIRKFHNITNSIILLDEIQSIPYKFWPIINKILKEISNKFNVWIILMTATQPLIFKENDEIIPLIDKKDEYFRAFNRVKFKFDFGNKDFEEFKEEAIETIFKNKNKNMMFVLNTINSSKELYEMIREQYVFMGYYVEMDSNGIVTVFDEKSNEKADLIYLSTNIIPKHRLNKINHVKESKNRIIIVSTQLIEAGVDITVDIIYRDLAPLDSIIQTAGRCNRNYSDEIGEVNVVNIVNEKNRSLGNFVYGNILLQSTKTAIGDIKDIDEKDFNQFSQRYYEILLEDGVQEESKELLEILNKLNYSDISSKFKILDTKSIPKIDVFVNVNDKSNEIWNEYNEIQEELVFFKRKLMFTKIKGNFYNYVISVNPKNIGRLLLCNEWLGFINTSDLEDKYNLETGFIYEKDEEAFIL